MNTRWTAAIFAVVIVIGLSVFARDAIGGLWRGIFRGETVIVHESTAPLLERIEKLVADSAKLAQQAEVHEAAKRRALVRERVARDSLLRVLASLMPVDSGGDTVVVSGGSVPGDSLVVVDTTPDNPAAVDLARLRKVCTDYVRTATAAIDSLEVADSTCQARRVNAEVRATTNDSLYKRERAEHHGVKAWAKRIAEGAAWFLLGRALR